jgi:DNA-binding MarR family transcriptional regulator
MPTTRARGAKRAATIDPADPAILEAFDRLSSGVLSIAAAALASAGFDFDLTILQWRTLTAVSERPDGLRVSEVAAIVGSSLPSASRLVDRLRRRGLVATQTDAADRRATRVRATPAGQELRTRIVDHRQRMLRNRLAGRTEPLPSDLQGGLEAIADALGRSR